MDQDSFDSETANVSRRFIEGLIARMTKDYAKAQSAFIVDRDEQEKVVHAHPDDASAFSVLGLIDAALGRKEEALRESRHAIELLPAEKNPLFGPRTIACLAIAAAWLGDKDLACQQLAEAIRYPTAPSYGHLKLMPWWDPLRGDPRFEKIVASLSPKEK